MKNQIKSDLEARASFYTPTLILRIKSMLIDALVVVMLMYFFTIILDNMAVESALVRITAFILVVLYEPICITLNRTVGQAMMGIRVKNFTELSENQVYKNISFFSSLLRFAIKITLGLISFLTVHSDIYGRAIHDKLANSVMIVD